MSLDTIKLDEKKDDEISLGAYEKRVEDIFLFEENQGISSEIIPGPKMPLRILKNNLNPNSKQLVFLVHGSGMNEYAWAPVLKPLEKEGINAVTFSWRGHSQNLPFDRAEFVGTGLMDYVNDAEAVLEKFKKELCLKDEQILIVGHSFGTIINSFLVRGRGFKSVLNFCAGYPNEEYLKSKGVNVDNKVEITKGLGEMWGFASEEYIKNTLEEARQGKVYESYREMGKLKWYLSELFNLDIPDDYNGPLEKLLGPSSKKAVADGLLNPPFLPKREEIKCPMHFFAATEDAMVPGKTIAKFAEAWKGTYKELPGPHIMTYSPYVDKYIDEIITFSKQL